MADWVVEILRILLKSSFLLIYIRPPRPLTWAPLLIEGGAFVISGCFDFYYFSQEGLIDKSVRKVFFYLGIVMYGGAVYGAYEAVQCLHRRNINKKHR